MALAYDRRSRAFIALSVMGIAVALAHGYDELTYTFAYCTLSKALSCASVFASGYTTFPPGNGIDFWVYGVVWFPVCLILGLWVIRTHGTTLGSTLVPFLMIGNIFTLYPWYIEIRLLNGIYCPVCISLYLINYVMTAIAASSWSSTADGPMPT